MPERKKRAAAYVRVSTDGQAEGTSAGYSGGKDTCACEKGRAHGVERGCLRRRGLCDVVRTGGVAEAFWGRAGLGGTTRYMFLGRTGWPVPVWIS